MKKVLLFVIIVLCRSNCFGQTPYLTITNNAPLGCDVTIPMYADATYGGYSANCGQYISNSFTIAGGGTTVYWCNPVIFETGPSGTCTGPLVDWASSPAGDFMSTPPSFQWNRADFYYSGSGCPRVSCTPNYSTPGSVEDQCLPGTCPFATVGNTWGNFSCHPYAMYNPYCGTGSSPATIVFY